MNKKIYIKVNIPLVFLDGVHEVRIDEVYQGTINGYAVIIEFEDGIKLPFWKYYNHKSKTNPNVGDYSSYYWEEITPLEALALQALEE